MPWKLRLTLSASGLYARFNSATACYAVETENGMAGTPYHCERFNSATACYAVETLHNGQEDERRIEASIRPRLVMPWKLQIGAVFVSEGKASIRPRLVMPWKRAKTKRQQDAARASIRPRLVMPWKLGHPLRSCPGTRCFNSATACYAVETG